MQRVDAVDRLTAERDHDVAAFDAGLLRRTARGGRLEISFKDDSELDRLLGLF